MYGKNATRKNKFRMPEYSEYMYKLDVLISDILQSSNGPYKPVLELSSVLNEQPNDELRRLVTLEKQRASGAFFTSHELASIALEPLQESITNNSIIADLACGVGDLLISCVNNHDQMSSALELVSDWNTRLIGHDIHPEFISVAKRRLLLSALQKAKQIDLPNSISVDSLFSQISAGDGLNRLETIQKATHIVLNPPFVRVQSTDNCSWGNGKVNLAAIFLDTCVSNAKPKTRIVAILPDVLRSGSLYKKWREEIASKTTEIRCELYGQFSKWADVHVFILDLVVNSDSGKFKNPRWNQAKPTADNLVQDYFEVCVGTVVDYRTPHEGKLRPYVTPSNLPPWHTVTEITTKRKFSGRVLSPPFVAVRRTSRGEDRNRAVPTIVDYSEPVAVENHLLILSPFSKSIDDCKKLVANFKDQRTSDWLNQTIRCRHLTVSALKLLPWWQEE